MPDLAKRITFYRDAVVIDGQQIPWHIADRDIEVQEPTSKLKIVNLPLIVEDVTFRSESLFD